MRGHRWLAVLLVLGIGLAAPAGAAAPKSERQLAREQVKTLLRARDYAGLERLLTDAQRRYESNPLDIQVARLFGGFYLKADTYQPLLDAWVAGAPQSANARLARGMYHLARGWKARGNKYWSETPPQDRAAMDDPFLQAVRDTRAALERNPRLMPGYYILIETAMVYGQREVLHGVFQDAMKLDPLYYDARNAYLNALDPKWGGSAIQMNRFIEDTRRYYDRNPDLKRLEAKMHEQRARQHDKAGRYAEAVEEYTRTLVLDPDWHDARGNRGYAYQMLSRYDEARADFQYSAERGASYAKYQLGWLYLYGRGVPRDHREAARWLGEAAEEGIAGAQSALAALYWEGSGVPQDKPRAEKLWRAAAAKGDTYAKESLAKNGLNKK